jgi:hypothetical protein
MVLPLAIAWLGAANAWCFCGPATPSVSAAHACCEDGPGLVPNDGDCCRNTGPGQTARSAVVPSGGSPVPGIAPALAPLAPSLGPPPSCPRVVSSPAVVLRV